MEKEESTGISQISTETIISMTQKINTDDDNDTSSDDDSNDSSSDDDNNDSSSDDHTNNSITDNNNKNTNHKRKTYQKTQSRYLESNKASSVAPIEDDNDKNVSKKTDENIDSSEPPKKKAKTMETQQAQTLFMQKLSMLHKKLSTNYQTQLDETFDMLTNEYKKEIKIHVDKADRSQLKANELQQKLVNIQSTMRKYDTELNALFDK